MPLIPSHKLIRLVLILSGLFTLSGCASVFYAHQPDYVDPATEMEFVLIKGGTFQMGDESGESPNALPVHTVTVPDFYAGISEVTYAEYDRYLKQTQQRHAGEMEFVSDTRPASKVSWDEADAMAKWMTRESGLPVSLPSEAQWEYMARAGTTSRFWTGDTLPKKSANCSDCGNTWDGKKTAPTRSFSPNPWGLYDTAGNVGEWITDDFHENYQGAPSDGSAWLAGENASTKIYRGGSWSYPAIDLAASIRDWTDRNTKTRDIGFRLVINTGSIKPRP